MRTNPWNRELTHPMSIAFQSAPQSLCILRLSAVGDVCHTVPVVRTIQNHWPNTKLVWIIGKLEASLVGDLPGIEFIIFDKSKGLGAYGELRRQLKGRKFDALLQMQISLRSSIAARLVKTPIRLGFDRERAKDYQWLFTNHKIRHVPKQHVMDSLFEFASAIGVPEHQYHWGIPISEQDREKARAFLPADDSRKVLAISPCSSARYRNWRNWSAQGYASVCDYAADKLDMHVVLTGGPSELEKNYGQQICQLSQHTPVNAIGQTNLKQLLAIIDRSHAIITPDSGPAHMATTVGIPVIGLYVTSNPLRTGPYFSQHLVVNKYPQALQQELGKTMDEVPWGTRVRSPDAMDLIKVEDVTAKLDELMSQSD